MGYELKPLSGVKLANFESKFGEQGRFLGERLRFPQPEMPLWTR
jgi:hypothetical protein